MKHQKKRVSLTKSLQFVYWNCLLDYLENQNCMMTHEAPYENPSLRFSNGWPQSHLAAWFNSQTNEIRVGYENLSKGAKKDYERLFEQKDNIEKKLGFPLEWDEVEGSPLKWDIKEGKQKIIILYAKQAYLFEPKKWSEYYRWMHVRLVKLDAVFKEFM